MNNVNFTVYQCVICGCTHKIHDETSDNIIDLSFDQYLIKYPFISEYQDGLINKQQFIQLIHYMGYDKHHDVPLYFPRKLKYINKKTFKVVFKQFLKEQKKKKHKISFQCCKKTTPYSDSDISN